MKMPVLSRKYQVLLIIFVVLGIFYPAIFAGENSVDDARMLYGLADAKLDVVSLFRPNGSFYYRPLLMLTFYLDQFLWSGAESFMHLENILLHCANAVLVYFLVLKLVKSFGGEDKVSPLLASLLFAIHPITTESVNWISGRTDLLATFFVLLSVLVLLTASQRRSTLLVLLSAGLFVCAIMSKEVVVFFLPMACLLLWLTADSRRYALRLITFFSSPFIFLVLIFVVVRVLTVPASSYGVDDLLAKWHYGFYDTIRVSFKVFGFYVKKMFVPVPLNFTIRQVSDLYAPFGLGVAALSVWLYLRHLKAFLPFLIAFFMTAPAIIVALTNVAWTPIAERYIYLSVVFVAIGIAPLLLWLGRSLNRRVGILLLALLFASAATVTAQRNLLWQDNRLLYADTLQQNPDFSAAHNELGIALMENGQYLEAEAVLTEAINDGFGSKNPLLYINMAKVYMERNDYLLARNTLLSSFAKPADANVEVLKMLAKVSEVALLNGGLLVFDDQAGLLSDMVDRYRQIYEKSRDPFHLYRAGQLLLGLKRNKEAAVVFAEVADIAPADAYYAPAARKLSLRLLVEQK
jgi:tetratricopeptide (TPR) repeat protein